MSKSTSLVGVLGKVRREGTRGVARRVVRRAYQALDAASLDFGLLPRDVADSTRLPVGPAPQVRGGGPLTVGWITTPPAAGSGGHTTMFRMVAALEARGHRCVVILYDRHHGVTARHAETIRSAWPGIRAEIRSVADGMGDLDACIATGWESAHVLATRGPAHVHKLYFIQDYEPFFYPRGSEYELAADTYRFGFTNIALGRMVHDRLRHELGVASELVPFSCDTSTYGLHNEGRRHGVVFYAKPGVPRRGYRVAALALREFHERHPEQAIHVYGDAAPDLDVPAVRHERLTPRQLNDLYNTCAAGIAMSFTNISLVAEEMLAAGCLPVVNDSPDSRADLASEYVVWAPATAGGVAEALGRAVASASPLRSIAASQSVRTDDWRATGARVVALVEAATYGRAAS